MSSYKHSSRAASDQLKTAGIRNCIAANSQKSEHFQIPPDITCPRCKGGRFFTRPKSQHVGLYCAGCGRWIKWLPQGRSIEKIPFGRHRGTAIRDLPDDYLNWILENIEFSGSLYKAISDEFERRGTQAAM